MSQESTSRKRAIRWRDAPDTPLQTFCDSCSVTAIAEKDFGGVIWGNEVSHQAMLSSNHDYNEIYLTSETVKKSSEHLVLGH